MKDKLNVRKLKNKELKSKRDSRINKILIIKMKENSLYDRKSLRAVLGKTADFNELAKDCVAFSNAEGGSIVLKVGKYRWQKYQINE